MIVPDANLLLYAHDASSPFHDRARIWWERCLSGREAVGLTLPVVFAFVRVGTSSRAFANPLTLQEASGLVQRWLVRRVTQVLEPGEGHVSRVLELLAVAGAAGGNLVTDAQIAAVALAHRGVVHTADRDFMRFPGVECCYPLDRR